MQKTKRFYSKLTQLIIMIILAFLMLQNFYLVNKIQGTGRVINYAGIVRGATQRVIKLEVAGMPKNELIDYLDAIIDGLRYGGGKYHLIQLSDEVYLSKLNALSKRWIELKSLIVEYRKDASKEEQLITLSEEYFSMANDMVGSAESYSDEQAKSLKYYEISLFVGIGLLIILSLRQTIYEMHLTRKNRELSAAAYLDKSTGLPGRRSCEETIWCPLDPKAAPYCVIIFDLNNLKQINDSLGHQMGDRLIKDFAGILMNFSSKNVFVGRYGGDEFLIVTNGFEEPRVHNLIEEIQRNVDDFNQLNQKYKIQYACGFEFGGDNLSAMLEKADQKMYENKKMIKESCLR